jgi:hypothetical protein
VVSVAAKIEVTDVVFDLSRRVKIVIREKDVASPKTTFNGFVITTEHRKCDQFADLCSGGSMNLSQSEKPALRFFEPGNRELHFPRDQGFEATSPGAQRGDFRSGSDFGKSLQCGGSTEGLCRTSAPAFETDVL